MIVSIITPSFNQGQFITETIQSIITQKGNFYIDYIVMDGGSTDSTVSILKKYEEDFKSCKIVYQTANQIFRESKFCAGISYRWFSEKDKGQSNAINKGWTLAIGDIYAWLNSDDIYLEDALNTVLEIFNTKKSLNWLYGIGIHIDKKGSLIEIYPSEIFNISRLKEFCFICQPTVFLRRSTVLKHGALNEKLHYIMDYEYWMRLSLNTEPPDFIYKPLACTRLYEETKTLSNPGKILNEIIEIQKDKFNSVSEHWLFLFGRRSCTLPPSNFLNRIIIWAYFIILGLYFNKSIPKLFLLKLKNKITKVIRTKTQPQNYTNNSFIKLNMKYYKTVQYIPSEKEIITLFEINPEGILTQYLSWNKNNNENYTANIENYKFQLSDKSLTKLYSSKEINFF
jgi:glycosyltransferase involved in cell wall biosynthesis